MRGKAAQIRAVFRGDERRVILNTYSRQKGFPPLLSLGNSAGPLMQISFFVAASLLLSDADVRADSNCFEVNP